MADKKRANRWEVQALGLRHRDPPPKHTHWRSYDLRGPFPANMTRALEVAIQSLSGNVPWPEIDEESWWRDVLTHRRVRAPTDKHLPREGWRSKFRLDQRQCSAITFTCNQCRQQETVSIGDLIKQLGASRNTATTGNDVLKCPNKRSRREGYDCAITVLTHENKYREQCGFSPV